MRWACEKTSMRSDASECDKEAEEAVLLTQTRPAVVVDRMTA